MKTPTILTFQQFRERVVRLAMQQMGRKSVCVDGLYEYWLKRDLRGAVNHVVDESVYYV